MKKGHFDCQGTLPKLGFTSTGNPLLEAFCKVAYQGTKKKKMHTIAKELMKPCALKIVKIILGKDAEMMVVQVPVYNTVIKKRKYCASN